MDSCIFEKLKIGKITYLLPSQLQDFQKYCNQNIVTVADIITIGLNFYRKNPEQAFQILSIAEKTIQSSKIYQNQTFNKLKIDLYSNMTLMLLEKTICSWQEDLQEGSLQVKKYLTKCQKVQSQIPLKVILIRALMHFYDGQLTKAEKFVDKIQDALKRITQPQLLLRTQLLKAQINLTNKKYEKALSIYKKCLAKYGDIFPIRARINLSYCFFYLNKFQFAKLSFQRVLKLDPQNVQAIVGLAILNQRNQNYQQYFQFLNKAYNINPEYPLLLLHLAEHFLIKKDTDKVLKLCNKGMNTLHKLPKFIYNCFKIPKDDYSDLKARFHNIQGQVYHIKNDFSSALQHYAFAYKKGLPYNQIAIAQCETHLKNHPKAIELLQDLYRFYSGKDIRIISDSYNLAAYLQKSRYKLSQKYQQSDYYYTEAIKYDRTDADLKIQYSYFLSKIDQNKALITLQQAQKLKCLTGQRLSLEIFNNLGVLMLKNNKIQQALAKFQQALQVVKTEELHQIDRKGIQTILKFNYGISLEKQKLNHRALHVYDQIISEFPQHIDSHIRKSYVLYKLGQIQNCINNCNQALQLCSNAQFSDKNKKVDSVLVMKAYIQYITQRYQQSKQTLSQLLNPNSKYPQILRYCLQYESIKSQKNPLNWQEFLQKSKNYLMERCQQDKYSVFQYMLLLIVLIQKKQIKFSDAQFFFSQIKQRSKDQLPIIIYNLAIFYFKERSYEAAQSTLLNYVDKESKENCQELFMLADYKRGQIKELISNAKKNVMLNPAEIKYRVYLIYATQKKIQFQMNMKRQCTRNQIRTNCTQLKTCINFHQYCIARRNQNLSKEMTLHKQQKQTIQILVSFGDISQHVIESTYYKNQFFNKKLQSLKQPEKIDETNQKSLEQMKKKQQQARAAKAYQQSALLQQSFEQLRFHQASNKRNSDYQLDKTPSPAKKKSNNRGGLTRKMPKLDNQSLNQSPKKDQEEYYFSQTKSTDFDPQISSKKLKKNLTEITEQNQEDLSKYQISPKIQS